MKLAASANRKVKLQKRSQLFISTHNETLSVTAMRVSNEDSGPYGPGRIGEVGP